MESPPFVPHPILGVRVEQSPALRARKTSAFSQSNVLIGAKHDAAYDPPMMLCSQMNKRRSAMFLFRLGGAACFLGLCMSLPEVCLGQGHGPSRVEVLPAIGRSVAPTARLVGTARPQLRTTVAAAVEGIVAELAVEDGDVVQAGQVLCRLRGVTHRHAHAEAVARVAELTAGQAVSAAELRKAEFQHERTERLYEQGRSTDKERSDALADYEAARSRVAQADGAILAAKAVADRLAYEVDCTTTRAPVAGVIVARHTQVGAWLARGGEVVDMIDLSTVRVRVSVPEAYVSFCVVGAEVRVTVDALERDFSGRIGRVIPDADENARTFPVDVDIANPDGKLMPGMFVRVSAPCGPEAQRVLVPKDAVVLRGDVPMIFVVRTKGETQMAEMLPVRIVSEMLDYLALDAVGLTAGDSVVVRGNEFMPGPGPVTASPHRGTDGSTSEELKPDSPDASLGEADSGSQATSAPQR